MVNFKGISRFLAVKKFSIFFLFCVGFLNLGYSNTENPAETEKNVHAENHHVKEASISEQISGLILGHIGDNHKWDIFGHQIQIPLPCIVYTNSKGLQIFSSNNFGHHNESEFNGFKMSHDGAKISWANASNTEKIWDFSITKLVMNLLIGCAILLFVLIWCAKQYVKRAGKAPKGFQNLLESLIVFMRDGVIKASIGPRYKEFLPFLLSVFFFIFILNLLGQIPIVFGGNVTGNIAVAMVLAFIVLMYVVVYANKYYWKHIFLPDVPKGLYLLMIPIEILGFIMRPFVLMLRLFANITAGHIIILGFFSLIFIFGAMKTWVGFAVSPASVGFAIFMGFLELLVAFLQAYVFTLLSSLYIGMAVEDHGHHSHDEKHAVKH